MFKKTKLSNLGAKVIQTGYIVTDTIEPGNSKVETITFPKPFKVAPTVVVGIGCWDIDPEASTYINDREYVSVSQATTTQVKVKWTCVSQTYVNARKIHWIAVGE